MVKFTLFRLGFAIVATSCCGLHPGRVIAGNGLIELDAPVPGGRSGATAISANGSVVVGSALMGPIGETAAFRWTEADGLTRLVGGGGRIFGEATAVSGDGNVVVGNVAMPISYLYSAFRWSQAEGMTSLGFLNGGLRAFAYGVSTDGQVVVGGASDGAAGYTQRAFRWTQAGGMVSLGSLAAGSESVALGVNSDGTAIVGSSGIDSSPTTRAFLWTPSGGMTDLGVLPGLAASIATGVNGAGNVVVGGSVQNNAGGYPSTTSPGSRAFRWTPSGGMTSLGTINGGASSYALGVSGDGAVVVGFGTDGAGGNVQRAFRWTQGSGMQKVEDWLRANGVRVAVDRTRSASGVNADGSVLVGSLDNDRGYIARVASGGSGLILLEDLATSIAETGTSVAQAVTAGQLLLTGLHGNPLAGRVAIGENCWYLSADAGRLEHAAHAGSIEISEMGACRRVSQGLQIGAGLGTVRGRQALSYSGEAGLEGEFAAVNVLLQWPDTNLWSTLTGVYQRSAVTIRRGYPNAGLADASLGRPSLGATGLRLRLDWENLATIGSVAITPYLDLTRINAWRSGYDESGGGFPASYDSQNERSTEVRIGAVAKHLIGADLISALTLESAQRLETAGPATSGRLVGLSSFDLPGQAIQRHWLRAGVSLESKIGQGSATLALNVTSKSEAPAYWLNLTYRVRF